MSQPSAASADLSTIDQDLLTQAQLDQLFNTVGYDHITFSQTSPEAAGKLSLQQYFTPPESVATIPALTPDLSDYNFGQYSTGYATPGPSTPQPYPVEQQQCIDPTQGVNRGFGQRPQPVRSHTNTSYIQSSQLPPGYTRRRSLSQNDINHSTVLNTQAPNPVFMRLQTPRVRSDSPGSHANRRRSGRHGRGTSQDTSSRSHHARGTTATSMPYYVNGLVPTRIGDPISPISPRYHRPAAQQQWPVHNGFAADVVFRQMRPEQMECSRKIIEIGAIAVRQNVEPLLERGGAAMLRKIDEVERYIKTECVECEGALKGCATIREALTRSNNSVLVQRGGDALLDHTVDTPDEMKFDPENNVFVGSGGGAEEDTLMSMLMQENASSFSDGHV